MTQHGNLNVLSVFGQCAQRKLLPDGRQYVLNAAVDKFRYVTRYDTVRHGTLLGTACHAIGSSACAGFGTSRVKI